MTTSRSQTRQQVDNMPIFLGTNYCTVPKMSKIEALRVLVNERLNTATAEIFGVIEKTIREYEVQASRLQQESNNQRRLLDSLLLKKQGHHTTTPAPPSKGCTSAPPPSKGCSSKRGLGSGVPSHSLELQYVFTSDADLLNFAANKTCPYCLKRTVATEMHLMKKHYSTAIHFTEKGIGKFVVPCTCKERSKDRSHWHCHICRKTISRRTNFKVHLYKIHGCQLQEQFQDTEIHPPSVSPCEDWFPPEQSWTQELSPGLGQEELQHRDSLHIKEEREELWSRQQEEQPQEIHQPSASHCEDWFPPEQSWQRVFSPGLGQEELEPIHYPQIKEEQEELWSRQQEEQPQVVHHAQQCDVGQEDPKPTHIKEEEEEEHWNSAVGEQLQGLKKDDNKKSIFTITCVESLNQDSALSSSHCNQTQSVEGSEGDPLPGPSDEPMETQPDGEGCGVSAPARDLNLPSPYCSVAENRARDGDEVWKGSITPQSGLKTVKSRKTKRYLSHFSVKSKKSMQHSASPNPPDSSCCQVCGKSFHYMYTLLNHAKTHTGDTSRLCGVCGKRLEPTESVVHHLKTHVNWRQTTRLFKS